MLYNIKPIHLHRVFHGIRFKVNNEDWLSATDSLFSFVYPKRESVSLMPVRYRMAAVHLWIAKENGQERSKSQKVGVVEVSHNFDGRYTAQSGGHQQLCSVGYDSLNEAREHIQYTCATTGVHLETIGNVFGYWS